MDKRRRIHAHFVLFLIVFLGAIFRFSDIDWDRGQHLQPDERYVSLVLTAISLPHSLSQYLSDQNPLSPFLTTYNNFIYGQLPLSAIKILSVFFRMDSYGQAYILGRFLSAFLDTTTIFLVFLLGKKLKNMYVGLFSAWAYALIPLAIQYAHFMVMESWSSFFWILTILLLLWWKEKPKSVCRMVILGISMGASGAVKATSVFLVGLFIFSGAFWPLPIGVLAFRFFQPTIFQSANWFDWSLVPTFKQAFYFQQQAIKGAVMFPPQWQWINTVPFWFPFKNLLLWGTGPALFLPMIFGIGVAFLQAMQKKDYFLGLLELFIVAIFFYLGGSFVKSIRYMLPLFGLLSVFAGFSAELFIKKFHTYGRFLVILFFTIAGLWALMFISVYRHTQTRIAASEWIYQNIPDRSKVMLEEWDDPLPLLLPGYPEKKYISIMEPVYAPDDERKKLLISRWVNTYDWIVLSSPRAKGSIGKLPQQFPLMSRFYKDLESGTLGFVKVAEFTSFPQLEIRNWKLEINDSSAEESFWVYDHPKVEIYQKILSK